MTETGKDMFDVLDGLGLPFKLGKKGLGHMACFQDQEWDDNDGSHQVSQQMNIFQSWGVDIVGISILTCFLCRK